MMDLVGWRWARRRWWQWACLTAIAVGTSTLAIAAVRYRADGAAVLVVVEDRLPSDVPWAGIRVSERRADAILVVRWSKGCDQLVVTSVPRDLVLMPGEDAAAVLPATARLATLRTSVERAFKVSIAATITLDLAHVQAMAEAVGPVVVELASESRDQRTGFHGGPGPVELLGPRAVDFLRSRTWEEFGADGWVLTDVTDEGRIDRTDAYLRAALDVLARSGIWHQLSVGVGLARNISIKVQDAAHFAAFLLGASGNRGVKFAVAPTDEERSQDDRRSPFVPTDYGAPRRLILVPGTPTMLGHCQRGASS